MAKKSANNTEEQKLVTLGVGIMGVAGFADAIAYIRRPLNQSKQKIRRKKNEAGREDAAEDAIL